MSGLAETTFWVAASVLFYTYVGYPALLWIRGRVRARPVQKDRTRCPRVSIVIAAHNEAARLARRIDNCLAADYPADRLEVIVVSDGSTDTTAAVLSRYAGAVRAAVLPQRVGKAAALNHGVALATGDLVLFTDARQQFDRHAIRELAGNFHDPGVGAVSGELVLVEPSDTTASHATGLYWRYEKWVRKAESRVDSMIGVTGAIYAIRRSLFTPLPAGTILDDVLIPMGIVLRGHRVVFEERALAYDHTAPVEQEFRRKVRTLAGNYQLFRLLPGLWSPRRNRVLFEFVSHKVSRLLAPFALLALFASGAVLAFSSPVYGAAFVLQVLCYGLAGIGWTARHRAVRSRLTTVPLTFVMLNSAALLGLIEFLRLERGAGGQELWVTHEAPDLSADGQRAA